ncbi:MAG: hypothetical protein TREMPRED_003000 [Tremellales sp. Tagirdzhanova-0007]|nr:MAG: hypothetical protein TREMPRED_003000 [Tremellales sp. Tagirdzhanova-0007]
MNFSPYQPPPDVPSTSPPPESSKSLLGGRGKGKTKRPWFNRDPSSYNNSYQSGGNLSDPTSVPQAYTNDPESSAFASESPSNRGDAERANAWESRFGWRVDLMAAASYLGGPVTALFFLIIETQNDYVRFHAYQSALLTTPLLTILLLFNLLLRLPIFFRIVLIIISVGVTIYTAFRAWRDAQEGLGRFWLPFIGEIAERWVGEE